MSGPWDRPPSPDDGDWPSEDIEPRSSADRPVEPWSADDPWQERPNAPPGWDEWPPPAPSTDDYAIEDPEPPASDPWAESWSDEAPGVPATPEPAFGPPPEERAAEAPLEPVAEPESEPEPVFAAPRIEPWSPDPDPWGAAADTWSPAPAEQETAPLAPPDEGPTDRASAVETSSSETPTDNVPVDEVPIPETLTEDEPAPEPEWRAPALEPDLEPDASPFIPLPGPEPEVPPFGVLPEPEVVASENLPEPEPEPQTEVAAFEHLPEPEPEPEPEREAEPVLAPRDWTPPAPPAELTPSALVEPALEPPLAEVEGSENGVAAASPWEADPWAISTTEPAGYAGVPEPVSEVEAEAEAGPEREPVAEAEPEQEAEVGARPEQEAESEFEAQPWSASAPWLAPEPENAELESGGQPELGGVEPEVPEPEWPERGESTQVLPTSWSPTTPAPAADELEPRSGDVRTSLGHDEETDADAEAIATTAEQAVPWLIGVILLLAGMVIVLLALIFAGDASLGGIGADASGSPQASPSDRPLSSADPRATPDASARVNPDGSAEASPTPAAGPEYGPLEMIYQGRAAALAPIYMLLRDFTAEDEPLVLAQDPNLDIRRFAWAPDGTVGAGLYADVLVSIETGVEKRRLGDGMSAITFGDDASTVYSVRITADGGDDVATLLSIDFESGESSEVASVSYPRPQVGAEGALAEAQFTDDGGTVRLYWLKDNTLQLWVLGGGTWKIEPSDGEVTELEEAVPLLWSPDGRSRVSVLRDGNETILRLVDRSGDRLANTRVTGRVSHLRWSPDGQRVVFTLGRSASGGGVLQDLYLWDLGEGETPDPMQITDTGAAFGAEWRGGQTVWEGQ